MEADHSQIKAVLNTLCIVMCGVSKFPQIKTNLQAKSVEGLSITGLFIDVVSYTISVRYMVTNGYAWMDFLEYPMVMAQMVFLISLALVYKKPTIKDIGAAVGAYACFFYAISSRHVTFPGPVILKLMLNGSTPLSIFGKLVYIRAIVTSKRGDLIARLPWFLNGTTSLLRIITLVMETADPNILIGLIFSVVLNYVIIGVAIYYTDTAAAAAHTKEDDKKQN